MTKIVTHSKKDAGLFKRFGFSKGASFAFLVCLLAVILAYRIQLTIGLFSSSVRPFDFNPGVHPTGFILTSLSNDLVLILVCFLISWLLSQGSYLFERTKAFLILRISGLVALNLVIVMLLIIHAAHIRLLFDAHTGLDASMIMEVWMNIPYRELLKFINLTEALLLLVPLGLFWLILCLPLSIRLWMARILLVLIIVLLSISVLSANSRTRESPSEIRLNPALFLLSDAANRAFARYPSENKQTLNTKENESGFQLSGPLYTNPIKPVKWLPMKNTQQWNVIFFIMEAVGTRYAFDTSLGRPMPMPFLHRLAKEGWYLKNHYTTSNISNKATFSLLSGLHDFFNRETFSIRPDIHVPSIYNFLARSHESFLVTPSPITWYFPTAFIKNSGLQEIHSYDNLSLKTKEEYHSLGHYIGRDEIQTVDFFIQRLNQAREPFLGIYFSFAAHLPYFDYGQDYRVREDDGRAINRYYNNLNLLDHMIRRIYDNLKERGLLERTLFVIVGDHGQAFGQHQPDNFMHHRYSYNENLETPAIFYQPALFKPRTFEVPTSHVDLLPTLLDAMRIPYDPALLDGDSLFQNRLKRKYIFFYGYEESISCLDSDRVKVQDSLKKNRCWAFDLKVDPEEKNPLDCSFYQPQLEALHRFTQYHDSSLVKYSTSVREKKEFQGH
ncbi:MAG TPA: LTA synthase family protein, partial [Thermodesulfobacteriota bacterium]|nr:LTA synthase family protein [Thermodesulfobacteriota bacterium]